MRLASQVAAIRDLPRHIFSLSASGIHLQQVLTDKNQDGPAFSPPSKEKDFSVQFASQQFWVPLQGLRQNRRCCFDPLVIAVGVVLEVVGCASDGFVCRRVFQFVDDGFGLDVPWKIRGNDNDLTVVVDSCALSASWVVRYEFGGVGADDD